MFGGMSFYSLGFMLFLPIVVWMYFAVPVKYKNIWLLLASYFFYACWSVKYVGILMVVTGVTYLCARVMQGKRKKIALFFCLTINLVPLLGMKAFSLSNGFVIPIGLSFYMLQALGYVIDVYREETKPEKNIINYALFVSFFPTILSGPIERSDNLLKQIQEGTSFSYERAKKGTLLIAFGFFEKILLADRIAAVVSYTYTNYIEFSGATILLVVILYAIQIYTDFAGYSYMALGIAKIFGFDLIQNFKQPYFAVNIREFWKRWHISLSQWLRDYVYISFGGSRCGKLKTYCNLMFTFLISGIWHGNGLKYLVWGGLHGGYQVIGRITEKGREHLKNRLHINTTCWSYRFFQGIITFLLVDFAWVFFSADSLSHALQLLHKIFFRFNLAGAVFVKEHLMLGLNESRWFLLVIELTAVFVIDLLHEKNISILSWLNRQNLLFRWAVYVALVFTVLVGELYNFGGESATFIYTRF